MARYMKLCRALGSGALLLGWLQGFGLINWTDFFTRFLSQWLAVLVSVLFGGNPSELSA